MKTFQEFNESLADDMIAHLRSKGLPAKKPMSKAESDAALKARAEKSKRENPPRKPEPYKEKYPLGGRDERSGRSYSEEVEQIDEISQATKDSYAAKAKSEVDQLKSHVKGEYGGIVKRMIARRKKGIKLAQKKTNS